MTVDLGQKLQKVLAVAGLGSRREIERWIIDGRCAVNGTVASLGIRVSSKDKITLDGYPLKLPNVPKAHAEPKLLLYYKKQKEICSASDPEGRRTVFESLPKIDFARWIMVGRLDFNTTGLLLFTTEGSLSHRLLHPHYQVEREYAVRVQGVITLDRIKNLTQGVLLDRKKTKFSSIVKTRSMSGTNHWYRVVLKEGRYREVRRMFATQNLVVNRLTRIRFGPVVLPFTLRPGQFIWLSEKQRIALKAYVGL